MKAKDKTIIGLTNIQHNLNRLPHPNYELLKLLKDYQNGNLTLKLKNNNNYNNIDNSNSKNKSTNNTNTLKLPLTPQELTTRIGSQPFYFTIPSRSIHKTHKLSNMILESYIINSKSINNLKKLNNSPLIKDIKFKIKNENKLIDLLNKIEIPLITSSLNQLNYEIIPYDSLPKKKFNFEKSINQLKLKFKLLQKEKLNIDDYILFVISLLDDFHYSNKLILRDLSMNKLNEFPKDLQLQINEIFPLLLNQFNQLKLYNISTLISRIFCSTNRIVKPLDSTIDRLNLIKKSIIRRYLRNKFVNNQRRKLIINKEAMEITRFNRNKIDSLDLINKSQIKWLNLSNYLIQLTPNSFNDLLKLSIETNDITNFTQFMLILIHDPMIKIDNISNLNDDIQKLNSLILNELTINETLSIAHKGCEHFKNIQELEYIIDRFYELINIDEQTNNNNENNNENYEYEHEYEHVKQQS